MISLILCLITLSVHFQPTQVYASDGSSPPEVSDATAMFQALAQGSPEIIVTANIKFPDYDLIEVKGLPGSDAIFLPIMGSVVIRGYIASNPLAYPVLDYNW